MINVLGLMLNMSLYTIDIYYNNGILDKVASVNNYQEFSSNEQLEE